MPVTIGTNELRERVQIFSYVIEENKEGEGGRKVKPQAWRWGNLNPCSLSSIALGKILIQTEDAQGLLMKAYTLTLRYKEKDKFDGVFWMGERYRRISAIQREGAFQKCIIAAFEEKFL